MTGRLPAIEAGRPLRIAVHGNSTACLVAERDRNVTSPPYPALLEDLLWTSGIPSRVDVHATRFEMIDVGVQKFHHFAQNNNPDVVVVNFGGAEMQPNVLPTPLARHFARRDPGGRGPKGMWVRRGIPRAWPAVRSYQQKAADLTGLRTWRLSPKRTEQHLTWLLRLTSSLGMLTLVLDVNPFMGKAAAWLPRIDERREIMQRLVVDTVRRIDHPDVRLIPMSSMIGELPDGLHLCGKDHARLAELLADEIQSWVRADEPAEHGR